MDAGLSFTAWVLRNQARHPGARGELSGLLLHVGLAARAIAHQVAVAPLSNMHGHAGSTNVQGEQQQKLDVLADQHFRGAMAHSGLVATLVSEEMEEPDFLAAGEGAPDAEYTVFYDPLDGSSNIDVNVTVGTIFGIYRHRVADRGRAAELLRPGREQVAAGYVMYGASTTLVLCVGDGPVSGFTLSPSVGEFFLTHADMSMPTIGKTYSVNESRTSAWDKRTQDLVQAFRDGKVPGGARGARYVGSLIADFHRTLLKGGIFMYPGERDRPEGKLRLLYEGAPLAMIAERAGGAATDGRQRILDRQPTKFHERCPLFIGSKLDVEEAMKALA
ncbi:MAG: class 1 fructose-bisphosphatase [Planctomycetes bacterium]|nr:class 1 fructose-bisphosphatase [Planctomycetota bacterium]